MEDFFAEKRLIALSHLGPSPTPLEIAMVDAGNSNDEVIVATFLRDAALRMAREEGLAPTTAALMVYERALAFLMTFLETRYADMPRRLFPGLVLGLARLDTDPEFRPGPHWLTERLEEIIAMRKWSPLMYVAMPAELIALVSAWGERNPEGRDRVLAAGDAAFEAQGPFGLTPTSRALLRTFGYAFPE